MFLIVSEVLIHHELIFCVGLALHIFHIFRTLAVYFRLNQNPPLLSSWHFLSLSLSQSIYLSIYLSIYPSIYLSIYRSICHLSALLQPNWNLGRLTVEVSRSPTIRHTPGKTPLNEWSSRRRGCYLQNTQQAQKINKYALSGIRTRHPSSRRAAELRLRLRDCGCSLFLSLTITNSITRQY